MGNKILVIDSQDRYRGGGTLPELDSDDYQVVAATGIEEAKGILERESIDAIMINDTREKFRKEGVEFFNFLKKDKRFKNIPLIFSDTMAAEGFSLDGVKYGELLPVDQFLKKPVEPEKLVRTIRELMK